MDIHNYIKSGILEEYVLGGVSDQERREVECMSHIYPEIREALNILETQMEQFARAYTQKVPDTMRSRILDEVRKNNQNPVMTSVSGDTASAKKKEIKVESPSVQPEKEIGDIKKSGTPVWAIAAAIAALVVAAWQFVENNNKAKELQALRSEQDSIRSAHSELEIQVAELSFNLDEVYDPAIRKVLLNAVNENFPIQLALFWNTENGQVRLDASALPELPTDKQYQLWVLKDGLPVDMGVLPKTSEDRILLAQKTTISGDAFAITIEPLGGQASPSLDQLVVMGNIG